MPEVVRKKVGLMNIKTAEWNIVKFRCKSLHFDI